MDYDLIKLTVNMFKNFIIHLQKMKLLTIRTGMILFICIYSFIFLFMLINYGYLNLRRSDQFMKDTRFEMISFKLENTVTILDNEIKKNQDVCMLIYDTYLSEADKKYKYNFEQYISDILKNDKDIIGISVHLKDGTILCYSNVFNPDNFERRTLTLSKQIAAYDVGLENTETIVSGHSYQNHGELLETAKIFNLTDNYGISMILIVNRMDIKSVSTKVFDNLDINDFSILFVNKSTVSSGDSFSTDTDAIQLNIAKSVNNSGYFTINDKSGKNYIFYSKSSEFEYVLYNKIFSADIESNTPSIISFVIIVSFLTIIVVSAVFILFKRKVYNPIMRIENAINGIVEGEIDLQVDIDKNNEFYPLADSLNTMIKRLKDLINREYSANILKKQAELNALQSQINPHFLYNTLESIRGLAIREGAPNVSHMTKALSNLFRYSVSQKENIVTLREELKNIDNYLIIQKYRFINKFNIIKEIDDTSDSILDYKLPKLSIQPIIENAIYHGLETKKGQGNITIGVIATKKRLIINIKDDGIGIEQDKLDDLNDKLNASFNSVIVDKSGNTPGIALINVSERIKLFFGDEYGLTVYSTPGVGTSVEMLLPLIKDDGIK